MVRTETIKAVIFDMDGVLLDSEPIHQKVNMDFFKEIGTPVSQDIYDRHFVGSPLAQMFEYLKREQGLEGDVADLVARSNEKLAEGFRTTPITPAAGVEDLITAFAERGLPMAVGSSSSPELIGTVIEKLGLSRYFSHLVSGYEVERGKPHPDLFLHVSELLGATPPECLVIEDSSLGVAAGVSAGMSVVGVRNPSSGDQDLSRADMIIRDFSAPERRNVLRKFEL
jgi:HAD superfamily hydrolase (TIGR01509 family)